MSSRIERIVVSIWISAGRAGALAQRCSQLFFQGLAEQIGQVLDRSSQDGLCRIEQLKLDLGVIPLASFEATFASRLLEQLERHLQTRPLTISTRLDTPRDDAGLSANAQEIYVPTGEWNSVLLDPERLTDKECQRLARACLHADFRGKLLRSLSEPKRSTLCRRMQTAAISAARDPAAMAAGLAALQPDAQVIPTVDFQPLWSPRAEAMLVVTSLICIGVSDSTDVPALAGQQVRVPQDADFYPWLRYLFELTAFAAIEWGEWNDWCHMLLKQSGWYDEVSSSSFSGSRTTGKPAKPDSGNADAPGKADATGQADATKQWALAESGTEPGLRIDIRSKDPTQMPTHSRIVAQEPVMVANAGVVLLWPLLPELFTELGVLGMDGFADEAAQHLAARWLDALVWNADDYDPERMVLTRKLCGLSPHAESPLYEEPVPEEVAQAIDNWLTVLPTRIPRFAHCTAADVRELFLHRAGLWFDLEDHDELQVMPHASDFLLVDLPWSLTAVSLPWLKRPLQVRWTIPALPPDWNRSNDT